MGGGGLGRAASRPQAPVNPSTSLRTVLSSPSWGPFATQEGAAAAVFRRGGGAAVPAAVPAPAAAVAWLVTAKSHCCVEKGHTSWSEHCCGAILSSSRQSVCDGVCCPDQAKQCGVVFVGYDVKQGRGEGTLQKPLQKPGLGLGGFFLSIAICMQSNNKNKNITCHTTWQLHTMGPFHSMISRCR